MSIGFGKIQVAILKFLNGEIVNDNADVELGIDEIIVIERL